ncbi:hypothetical protein AB0E69_22840 [Kribbella sp. NPDC026611]|uniref:hypothetical protein n=1 Tax=Kribbella sp. NPDC026611 TaxID=3154911 RepID=UPI0033E1896D
MPPAPDVPEPSSLYEAFTAHGPLEWPDGAGTAAAIARLYGAKATRMSLEMLDRALTVEPRITTDFLNSLPPTAVPHHLDRRVKSPESLARKIHEAMEKRKGSLPTDVLRYTALTARPDDLVETSRRLVDALEEVDWRVTFAMQSYAEGSRYKGIHAYLAVPGFHRVEVQFHSAASAKVKDLMTRWYWIERDVRAPLSDRLAARQQCIDLSATLAPPAGIDRLATLGGRPVVVNNYSDALEQASPGGRKAQQAWPPAELEPQRRANDGRAR